MTCAIAYVGAHGVWLLLTPMGASRPATSQACSLSRIYWSTGPGCLGCDSLDAPCAWLSSRPAWHGPFRQLERVWAGGLHRTSV